MAEQKSSTYKLFSEMVQTFAFECESVKTNTTPIATDRILQEHISGCHWVCKRNGNELCAYYVKRTAV